MNMKDMQFCQSCAMPLNPPADCGTNKDGSVNEHYCQHCFKDGQYAQDCTMEEMIEFCVPFVSKGQPYSSEEEARAAMNEFFPTLERWKK